jgi:MFS family permease
VADTPPGPDTPAGAPPSPRIERRLVLVIGAIVFVDTMFYAAIAPLLPKLAAEFHLSKLSAGVMTASYALGTLLGSIPGGVLAARAGPKPTVFAGLSLLALSTLAFGLLDNAVLLDVARFVEGVGGACSWAGGLAWIVAEAPPARRGGLIGAALGAAIAGALFGPVIGTLATAVGRAAAFSGVVVVAVVLIDQVRRLPSSHTSSGQGLRELRLVRGDRATLAAMWLTTLPAIASGLLNVLGPLRLHRFGATVVAIGATYLVATGIEAVLSPIIGTWSDRRGRLVPIRFGLAVTTVTLLCFVLPTAALPLAIVVIAIATSTSGYWAPAMAMLSDAAERRGLDQGLAAALGNLAWASGQVIGAGGGGAVAKVTGDGVPIAAAAGLTAVTLVAILVRGARVAAVSAPARSRSR